MHFALVIVLGLHYTATMILFGSALFRNLVLAEEPAAAEAAPVRKWLMAWAAIALVSALVLIALEAGSMTGDWSAAGDLAVIGKVIVGTVFGQVWLLRVVLNIAAIAFAAAPPRSNRLSLGVAGIAAVLLATLALTGHAYALGGPYLGLNQAIHLLATGAWVGGVPALALRLRRLGGDHKAAARILYRFSGYGAVNVAVIIATGLINNFALTGWSVRAIETDYGHVLLIKLGLVAAMISVAGANRFWLLPNLAHGDEGAASRLRRLVYAETALGIGVVFAACLLGSLPPSAS